MPSRRRRLLGAETVLRRAVPVLIITFWSRSPSAFGVQIHDNRRQVVASVLNEIDLLASQLVERLDRATREQRADARRLSDALAPFTGRGPFRYRDVIVSDTSGIVLAATSLRNGPGRQLVDIFGPHHLLSTTAHSTTAREIELADGTRAFAIVHPSRRRSVTSRDHRAKREGARRWRSDTTLTVTLSATTSFVVLILGFAFHWQAARATGRSDP
ncbi:MAG: hypothetical protein R3D52_14110 [Xanthobacteraceae bacterium]